MLRVLHRRLLVVSFLSFLSLRTAAALTNRTIDDEKGDSVSGLVPEYSPPGAWHQGSTCTACFVHLDPSQTLDGTWHDTTYNPSDPEPRTITIHFNGTAVYVYNALANTVTGADTGTNLTFTLDGSVVGRYSHTPTTSTLFDYNFPVYTKTALRNAEHELVIQGVGDVNPSLILFDYVVYTFDDSPTSTTTSTQPPRKTSSTSTDPSQSPVHSSPSIGAIVGGVVGGVSVLLLLVGLFLFFRRRRRHQEPHVQVIQEKPRKGRILTRLSVLGSELDPPSTSAGAVAQHESRPSIAITDAESHSHLVSTSQHSPAPLPEMPVSANSYRGFTEASSPSRYAESTAVPTGSRGAYLYGGKSDVSFSERSDHPPAPVPPPPASLPEPRSSPGSPSSHEAVALRSRVAALQKEVERLQERRMIVENPSESDDAPPQYDGPDGSSGPQ